MKKTLRKISFLRRIWQTWFAVKRAARKAWCGYTADGAVNYRLKGKFRFDNRSRGAEDVLLVLAGYKKELWEDVFSRVRQFTPQSLDVCVITSGLESEELSSLCERYGWSYLAMMRNSLTLSQNIAIDQHPKARWIYKIDEDVFLTDGFFDRLKRTYVQAEKDNPNGVGFVAPLLNVNGYCHVKILERMNQVDAWERQFGRLCFTDGIYHNKAIRESPDAARFMWTIGQIDDLSEQFSAQGLRYSVTPYCFSIGAILFERSTWLDMGMFDVSVTSNGLGDDENQLCGYCLWHTKAKVICESSLVGHLAFGPQTQTMLAFHRENRRLFMPQAKKN